MVKSTENEIFSKNVKKVAKKFGGNKKMRTFAIPKQTKRWW